MKELTRIRWRRTLRFDKRGIALPAALFGLVVISLLVTAALATSSVEVSLSRVQREGTRGLYAADAALEAFVAEQAKLSTGDRQKLQSGTQNVTVSGDQFRVTVTELFRGEPVEATAGSLQKRETYALLAERADERGRSVGAMIDAIRQIPAIEVDLDAALISAIDVTVSGSARISDGTDVVGCDSVVSGSAIRHALNTGIDYLGSAQKVIGGVLEDDRDSGDLMADLLDGVTIEELGELAEIRFGPMFDAPLFSGSPTPFAYNPALRWGCAPQLYAACEPADAARYPVIAIDANGGMVHLTGEHGQGTLLVRNGSVVLAGHFFFRGIVMADGPIQIRENSHVEGSVVVLGGPIAEAGETFIGDGAPSISFDPCQVAEALRGITIRALERAPQEVGSSTYGWYEVIR